MSAPETADRLMLVSEVQRHAGGAPWVLENPVWIQAGERFWLDEVRRALAVQDLSGTTRFHPCGFATGPDARR